MARSSWTLASSMLEVALCRMLVAADMSVSIMLVVVVSCSLWFVRPGWAADEEFSFVVVVRLAS